MTKEIIINATNEETRIAILEDSNIVELFVERPEYERLVGDIYKGKISRVLPGMQAALSDMNRMPFYTSPMYLHRIKIIL